MHVGCVRVFRIGHWSLFRFAHAEICVRAVIPDPQTVTGCAINKMSHG